MRILRDLPIKQKLRVIIILASAGALLLAGVSIVAADSILFRIRMERELASLAKIVGDNSTAALQFNDQRVATKTLAALRAQVHLVTACLYQQDGAIFAQYVRPGSAAACPAASLGEEERFDSGGLLVSHPVMLDHRRVGTLVMLVDRGEIRERVLLYGGIVLLLLLGSTALAVTASSRMRDTVALPITHLASAARWISETGDYSIRVQEDSRDELGVLVNTFNGMVGRIQSRDAEVQNARNSLRTTLASIGDAVISTDAEGRITFVNRVASGLLGWSDTEITGKPIEDVFRIVNEFTRMKVESPVLRVLRDGKPAGLANHTLLISRDGAEIPIDDSAAPIVEEGRTSGVVLVFRDISERRRAQQDAAYLAAIVESSDDAIIGQSPAGIVQSWNSGAERLYGYRAAEVVGRAVPELLPPDRQSEEAEALERIQSGSPLVHFETVRVRKDGEAVDVSISLSPIRDRVGQIIGFSHVARDITEQKRTAEQMRQTQKLESLGVLAGGIAHDFNNLLTGILGNASMALEDLPRESPARGPLESVMSASERAAQLARQMLAYSGKGKFVVENIDLSARVRDTLPLIKAAIPATVEILTRLDEHLPPVEADAAQIQQLVMNVIINAAEAIPEGTAGTVIVTTTGQVVREEDLAAYGGPGGSELQPGPYVLFEVKDTGSGMDEETVARIFDPFFTTKFTGRGLGLAAVLGIVRGHRGAVRVNSGIGNGTTFQVLLPASLNAESSREVQQERAEAHSHGEGLVLVVDDEQIVRSLARQALERRGYTVLLAEDGADALDIFRREASRIRCVLLDLTMPKMNGEETLPLLQAVRSDVPVILSSGYNEAQAVRRFQGKGLAGFLQKPYRAGILIETVQQVLSNANGGPPKAKS